MKLTLAIDLGPLREEANRLAVEWAQRQVGNKTVRLDPIYKQKLQQAREVIKGHPIEETCLLMKEAALREVSVEVLAAAVVNAHNKEEERLTQIEMSRLEMKKIIVAGTVKDLQELIAELQKDGLKDLHQRRNQYRIVGGQVEKM